MSIEKPYQPSKEEISKTEEMMTKEEEEMSEERRKKLIETEIDAQLIKNLESEGLKLQGDSTEAVVYLKNGSHIKGVHEGFYNMYDYILFKTKSDSKIFWCSIINIEVSRSSGE